MRLVDEGTCDVAPRHQLDRGCDVARDVLAADRGETGFAAEPPDRERVSSDRCRHHPTLDRGEGFGDAIRPDYRHLVALAGRSNRPGHPERHLVVDGEEAVDGGPSAKKLHGGEVCLRAVKIGCDRLDHLETGPERPP